MWAVTKSTTFFGGGGGGGIWTQISFSVRMPGPREVILGLKSANSSLQGHYCSSKDLNEWSQVPAKGRLVTSNPPPMPGLTPPPPPHNGLTLIGALIVYYFDKMYVNTPYSVTKGLNWIDSSLRKTFWEGELYIMAEILCRRWKRLRVVPLFVRDVTWRKKVARDPGGEERVLHVTLA